jgi:hypothetical protein
VTRLLAGRALADDLEGRVLALDRVLDADRVAELGAAALIGELHFAFELLDECGVDGERHGVLV